MTNRKSRNLSSFPSFDRSDARSSKRKALSQLRQSLFEGLEQRQMLAVGPQLIGVQPNNSDLIENGVVRNVAPRELTFRFDDAQVIDPSTVSGIRISRAGGDGSFVVNSAVTDFGTSGDAAVQLTAKVSGQSLVVRTARSDLGAAGVPLFGVSGTTLTITLNSNSASSITVQQLINAINASPIASGLVSAKLSGGFGSAAIDSRNAVAASPINLSQNSDIVLTPGAIQVGLAPNDNEVTYRFAEELPDDLYRIEVFGFDDAPRGVVGLRNVGTRDLFVPSQPGTRQETIDFRLDLGTKITGVVPQPVVRTGSGTLSQLRDTIVVYFDGDSQFVGSTAAGVPFAISVENPSYYQLIYTSDSVRNTDDVVFKPTSVKYNAIANTATLKFEKDINNLPGSLPNASFRLRVGTRETLPSAVNPISPVRSSGTASIVTDFNSNGAVRLRISSQLPGEGVTQPNLLITKQTSSTPVVISVSGVRVTASLNPTATANDLILAIRGNAAASNLIALALDSGSVSTVIGSLYINYGPLQTVGLGDTFTTASDLGLIGSSTVGQTSLYIGSSIEPTSYSFNLPGASDDLGHRDLGNNFENHVNQAFGLNGADNVTGVTTISYNFQRIYGSDSSGQLTNSITENQRQRIREAISLWANYLGVQFVETANRGITFATGALSAVTGAGARTEGALNFGVRIDPTFNNSLLVMQASRNWKDKYGEDYFRHAMAAIGELLGLTHAGDLPPSVLMSLNAPFLDGDTTTTARNSEPIFPSPQDIVHGQFVHRPDSNDVDLYKFNVDFGPNGESRVGLLTAETFAERLTNSSSLDTYLQLYKERQATATSNFNTGENFQLKFTAVQPGKLGNNLQIFVTTSSRSSGGVLISVGDNSITLDLNSRAGLVSTGRDVISAIRANLLASRLVTVDLVAGSVLTTVGDRAITYSPITLRGGDVELIAQNDDYFSEDSLIRASLSSGVYYLGVSASGNDSYNPTISGTGFGGRTQGNYAIRLNFRAQVDANDAIRDIATGFVGDTAVTFDGDSDGQPGGVYNFWFETRPLDRALSANGGGNTPGLEGKIITITNSNGQVARFEFSADAIVGSNNTRISYANNPSPSALITAIVNAINSRTGFGVTATQSVPTSKTLVLKGERSISLSTGLTVLDIQGKTIFVDKSAATAADGSLTRPFNNLAGAGVNAFAATLPGDIVRVVGNGGNDGLIETVGDNFAYEIGFGLLPNTVLSDGATLDVPKGTILMVDPGAIFKMRRSRIGVGSTNLGIDRSNGAIQVLGTPVLTDAQGNAIRQANGTFAKGDVYFTSWLDQSIGLDTFGPNTTPGPSDWGGIAIRRDVDDAAGRSNPEDEGIFINYVNHADIRYGGGGNIVIDGVQQVVNAIQIVDVRPTITNNQLSFNSDSAMSAAPNSFEETRFTEARYQNKGLFTPDYDRVGPDIHGNRLVNNSVNGLFVRVVTPAGGTTRTLTVPGRFDDIDIVHVITQNLLIESTPGGLLVDQFVPDVSLASGFATSGGTLGGGNYNYRITFVDRNGYETISSAALPLVNISGGNNAVSIGGLPAVTTEYKTRRIYRSSNGGVGPYSLIGELDGTSSEFLDRGTNLGGTLETSRIGATAVTRPRLDASLIIDPGTVVKLAGARIEIGHDALLLAEGTADLPIVFTSRSDDRFGAGGTFDTTNNGSATAPQAGEYGGIYASPTSFVSLDYVTLAFGGGVTPVEGSFRAFNVLELQQATGRVTNSTFETNANGVGGQGNDERNGRLTNLPATLLARGTQPILIANSFIDNLGDAITLDANSFGSELQGDTGRQSGAIDRFGSYDENRGPLLRENRFSNNQINGLVIRGDNRSQNASQFGGYTVPATGVVLSIEELPSDELIVESVWDDTDIVHVLREGIFINNDSHGGGLRLQSAPNQSLVVKLDGPGSNFDPLRGAGITATGDLTSISDRIGGTLHLLGQPGFPVIITSLKDDTVGAGLKPDGRPQSDTNNDGIASTPQPGDYRGILLDQNSNDRNVGIALEQEASNAVAPGSNGTINTAQFLGELAANPLNSDENLRLGYVVEGVLSEPGDRDIYSFTGIAGTTVYLDIDKTKYTLDTVLEVLDANGALLARSDNSTTEQTNPASILTTGGIDPSLVRQLIGNVNGARRSASGQIIEDGTLNPRDAGLQLTLPGTVGTRSSFFFQVRSASINIDNENAGLTSGSYQVQLRMREGQEFPGSVVQYADIRYATNGVHLRGLPAHSPLLGEIGEDESTRATAQATHSNDTIFSYVAKTGLAEYSSTVRPQYVGNILQGDRQAISIAGRLNSAADQDYYMFSISEQDVLGGVNGTTSVVFDIDYADGLNRPDTQLALYRLGGTSASETATLIYIADDSNIADDQRKPLSQAEDPLDFSAGSSGTRDPFLNAFSLTPGNYAIGVTSKSIQQLSLRDPLIERLPVVQPVGRALIVSSAAGTAVPFTLAGTSAADQPAAYFQYSTAIANNFSVFIRRGAVLTPATYTIPITADSQFRQAKINLAAFAGQDNLEIVFRDNNGTPDNIRNVRIGFAERGEAIRNAPSYATYGGAQPTLIQNDIYLGQTTTAATPNVTVGGFANLPNDADPTTNPPGQMRDRIIDLTQITADMLPTLYIQTTSINAQTTQVYIQSNAGVQLVASLVSFDTTLPNPVALDPFRATAIDLRAYVGQTITITVRGGGTGVGDVVSVNAAVGFNAIGVLTNPPANSVGVGEYQLEIRRGDKTSLTSTNERDTASISLIAPAVTAALDGTTFTVSDGADRFVFEYSLDNRVGQNRVIVPITAGGTSAQVATAIRNAINSNGVQSRLNVTAAGEDGLVTGNLTSARVNLFGEVFVTGITTVQSNGDGDKNLERDQGQVLIVNSFFRQNRDYGVVTEAGKGQYDPRDTVDTFSAGGGLMDNGDVVNPNAIIQSRPRLVGTAPGAVRNLQQLNTTLTGGFTTGIIISSNVIEGSGLGGIHIAGENPIWQITPAILPPLDASLGDIINTHFGSSVNDQDTFIIDSGRNRAILEFDDVAGAPTTQPNYGSGQAGGNGLNNPDAVPVYYREDAGAADLRSPTVGWGFSAYEVLQGLRDSILGSVLVTNGTTQNITATIAMSTLGPANIPANAGTAPNFPNYTEFLSFNVPNYANRPALYLEGVSNLYYQPGQVNNGGIWDIRRVDRAEAPQPFVRALNNTIYGNDGRQSFNPDAGVSEPNDTIATAVNTQQGIAQNPISYNVNGIIGDSTSVRDQTQDVDFYQFHLDIGERVRIDVDTTNTVDTSLRIFDSNGRPVDLNNGVGTPRYVVNAAAAPGETAGVDPYIDYTAIVGGTYYVGVSAAGNISYNPNSLADRAAGSGTGAYQLSLQVSHPQTFTIDVQDAASYVDGSTFQVLQVPDINATVGQVRTFEFTRTGAFTAGNIPVFIGPNYKTADVARSIATAISNAGLNNTQNLPNPGFADANPLLPVSAVALGGIDGIGPGLRLFPGSVRNDSTFVLPASYGGKGIGYEHLPQFAQGSGPFGFGPTAADGLGTTEKWVVVSNAAAVRGNGVLRVDPEEGANNNLDQLLPETGILVTGGASPSLINNVFLNVQTPIVREETRSTQPLDAHIQPAAFGSTAQDRHPRPSEVIIGGSIYQNIETATALNRQNDGIEAGPTNVPNTAADFNNTIGGRVRLVVDAAGSNFIPVPNSLLIDSSLSDLKERDSFQTIKSVAGISPSPIKAPSTDASGQLRVDDPTFAPPQGFGGNVFIDRGALDRADFTGPSAALLEPLDNDAAGNDISSDISFVRLESGILSQIRLQLLDGFDSSEPFAGLGIDDSTVVGSDESGLRSPGAAITLTENGRLLTEGVDYTFSYNATTNELVLTPLAGVFREGRVYEVTLNNRDRFVINTPSGEQVRDGDQFTVVDSLGGRVVFEFNTGYQLQLPLAVGFNIPQAGGGPGGVQDGGRFSVQIGSQIVTFEFDNNNNFVNGNIPIPFFITDSQSEIAGRIITAIRTTTLPLTPVYQASGFLSLGAPTGTTVDGTNSSLTQPSETLGFRVPSPAAITDGQTFTISDSEKTVTFEFNSTGGFTAGRTEVNIAGFTTLGQVTNAILAAIQRTALLVKPQVLSQSLLYLGLTKSGSASAGTSPLGVVGIARGLIDGQTISITNGANTVVFEFDTNGSTATGNRSVPFTVNQTAEQIATTLARSISQSSLGFEARGLASGAVVLAATNQLVIDLATSPNIGLSGNPAVSSKSTLTVGANVADGQFFTITRDGTSVTFEFNNTSLNNGSVAGRTQILYSNASTPTQIAGAIRSAIQSSRLSLTATSSTNSVLINDDPLTSYNLTGAPSLTLSGVPGGVIAVNIASDPAFTSAEVASAIVRALTLATNASNPNLVFTSLKAATRGGASLFLENAVSVSQDVSSYFLRGIQDLAGNFLRPNRINDETQFTILTPGIVLDFGDAPDPFSSFAGQYPTLSENGGASHVVFDGGVRLGTNVSTETDGKPTPNALGDDGDDGVVFSSAAVFPVGFESSALLSRQLPANITVTLSGPGFVDAWVDFNADGDWNDPGEQILTNEAFFSDSLSRTFTINVPLGSPLFIDPTFSFARFRASSSGGLLPTGLATSGEVEDYRITLLPNSSAPTVATPIPNQTINEDAAPLRIPLTPGVFRDPDSFDRLTFTASSSNTAIATVRIDGNDLLVTLVPNQNGVVNITVTATDLTGFSVSDTFQLTINPQNDAPTGVADSYSVPINRFIDTTDPLGTITEGAQDNGVLANDIDIDGDALTAVLVTGPTRGTLTLRSNGTFLYRPPSNAVIGQTDTFTYRAVDPSNASSAAITVTITFAERGISPHYNRAFPTDVVPGDAPGITSPIDALSIINFLNANRGRTAIPVDELTYTPPPFRDANNDFVISALDVLAVVNYLNNQSRRGLGNGEGESVSSTPVSVSNSVVVAPPIASIDVMAPQSTAAISASTSILTIEPSPAIVAMTNVPKTASKPAAALLDEAFADFDASDDELIGDFASTVKSVSTSITDSVFIDLSDTTAKKKK